MVNKIAFLFPGQGSQYIGMGKKEADSSPEVKQLFEKANEFLGFSLSEIMWDGPEEKLKDTSITQPALFVSSAAAVTRLRAEGIKPSIAAGHSLGEYSALFAADVLSFDNALKLVSERGKAMQKAATSTEGTMAAIIGLAPEKISEICSSVSQGNDVCTPANFNSDSQTVIAGTKNAIAQAMTKAKEAGAMKCIELKVAGAFHSPLMSPAVNQMKPLIESTSFADSKIPVVTNVDSKLTTTANEFKSKLIQQIDHPVQWNQSAKSIIGSGVDTFIEVGAGKVLSSMIKRLDRKKTVLWTDDFESIRSATCV